jgi:hypothetical protein
MALVALHLASSRLGAQQAPDPWPTDDPAEGGYSSPSQPAPQDGYGQAYAQQGYPQPQAVPQPRGFSAEQLEQMVAPIALYPDNLVSIVLAASTYPAQVATAGQWVRMQGNAPAEQIAAEAGAHTDWDPSIKALTAFPQVLDQLANNLQWTTDLGNAYYNQPQDVMQSIQVMRSRAQAAGNLQSTPQQEVTNDQGYIELAPPSPQIVYVPTYNPWAVYGAPVPQYPGYDWLGAVGSFFGNAFIQWGPGIGMQAFAVTPFGWLGWGLNWFAQAVLFNHSDYCTHSYEVRDWGFAHGGPRGFRGWERAGFRDGRGWNREDFMRAGYNRGNGQGYGRFGNNRIAHGTFNHGANGGSGSGNSYGHFASPQQGNGRWQNYGGAPSYAGRPASGAMRNYGSVYGSRYGSAYGSGMFNRNNSNYPGRTGTGYSSPVYRAPASPRSPLTGLSGSSGYRGAQGSRAYGSYGGSSFAQSRPGIGNEHVSGGHQLFGGGRQSNSLNYGGNHSAKSYSFGGGHSSWGGSHSGGGFGGGGFKAPHSSGGGHFGGSSHSGGGGHSSGVHSNHR